MLDLNECIKIAMKAKNSVALYCYKEIKTEKMKWETAKNAKPYDDTAEIKILKKLASEHEDSMNAYLAVDRDDIASEECDRLNFINSLIPAGPTEEEIDNFVGELIPSLDGEMKMGNIIKMVKSEFPTADGKLIAKIVKQYI